MSRSPAGSSPYIPLEEVFARSFKTVPWEQLQKILARGQVPMVGTRSDMFGYPRDRIEGLLAKASESFFLPDSIRAYWISSYGSSFHTVPPDRLALFGQHSEFTKWPTTNPVTIEFNNIAVHWPKLIEALEEAGFTMSAKLARPQQQRGAYRGELASFIKRLLPKMLADLSDEDIARRFEDHVESRVKKGTSVLKLPQRRHIANQVAKLREQILASPKRNGM
jgi:hypothetical protein